MFNLSSVLDYLKVVLNYNHSQLLDFVNIVPGKCNGDDVMLKGSDIERYLGVDEHNKLRCKVIMYIL
jgi:hypothetical protein